MADSFWRPPFEPESFQVEQQSAIRSLEDLAGALLAQLEESGDILTPEQDGSIHDDTNFQTQEVRVDEENETTNPQEVQSNGRESGAEGAIGASIPEPNHPAEGGSLSHERSYDLFGPRTPRESAAMDLWKALFDPRLPSSRQSISSFPEPIGTFPNASPIPSRSNSIHKQVHPSSISSPPLVDHEPRFSKSSPNLRRTSSETPPLHKIVGHASSLTVSHNDLVPEHSLFDRDLLVRLPNSQFVDVASLSGRSSPRESIVDMNAIRIWNQHHPSIIFEEPSSPELESLDEPSHSHPRSFWQRLLGNARPGVPASGQRPARYHVPNEKVERPHAPAQHLVDHGRLYRRPNITTQTAHLSAQKPNGGQFEPESQIFAPQKSPLYRISGAFTRWTGPRRDPDSDSPLIEATSVVVSFILITVPEQLYLHVLLRLPSLYLSRVARIFEDAAMSVDELRSMVIEKALQEKTIYAIHIALEKSHTSPAYASLKHTWEIFIDSVMREWKTFNIISVLLLTAIMTILQIDSAAEDPIIRYAALLSLICALISLLFGCMYIMRFGTMRKTYKATEWAMEAAQKQFVWWNVWILLAMPAVWLTWSIILYIVCIMAFVWRTNLHPGETVAELPIWVIKTLRILITVVFGLGVLFGCLIVSTFRRYGDKMDQSWQNRIEHLRREKELDEAMRKFMGTYHRKFRNDKTYAAKSQQAVPRRSKWTTRASSLGGTPWYAAKSRSQHAVDKMA